MPFRWRVFVALLIPIMKTSCIIVIPVLLLSGCGLQKEVPTVGRGIAIFASALSNSLWSASSTIDTSIHSLSNIETLTESGCMDSDTGFYDATLGAGTGCVQQAPIQYSGGRWFVGFPQKLSTTSSIVNPMAAVSQLTGSLFGGLGSGLGYLSFLTTNQSSRYISLTKLKSGKVLSIYWVLRDSTDPEDNAVEVYSNVYNPTTKSWSTPLQLSSGAALLTDSLGAAINYSYFPQTQTAGNTGPVDLAWDDYHGAAYTSPGAISGNFCRPRISASGSDAMAIWCEMRAIDNNGGTPTFVPYVRYSIYREGVGWAPYTGGASVTSAPLLAKGSSSSSYGMNLTTVAAFKGTTSLADGEGTYHPGMARRITIPAFVPNALMVTGSSDIFIASPIPRATSTNFAAANFSFSDAAALPSNPQGIFLTNAHLGSAPTAVSTDGTNVAVSSSVGDNILLWTSMPTTSRAPEATITGLNEPSDVFVGHNKLIFGEGDTGDALVGAFSYIPSASCVLSYGLTGATCDTSIRVGWVNSFATSLNPSSVFYDGSKFYFTHDDVAAGGKLYIFNRLPVPTATNDPACRVDVAAGTCGDCNNSPTNNTYTNYGCVVINGLTSPKQVFSDGKKLFLAVQGVNKVYVWNRIPTADVSNATTATVTGARDFELAVSNATGVFSDGARLYATGDGDGDTNSNDVMVWRKMPFESIARDSIVSLPAGTAGKIAWSQYLPTVTSGGAAVFLWPYLSSTVPGVALSFNSAYSPNPRTTDRLHIKFRGLSNISGGGYLLPAFTGDPVSADRCVAIGNIVNQINADTRLKSVGISASLPEDWGEAKCGRTTLGEGQYFYITHNGSFSPNDGADTGEMTQNAGTGNEDITVTAMGAYAYGRFFDLTESGASAPILQTAVASYSVPTGNGSLATSTIMAYKPRSLNKTNHTDEYQDAQYFVGKMRSDTNTPSLAGLPLLPPTGSADNPDFNGASVSTLQNPVDLTATSFIDVAGTGGGSFAVIQSSRAFAQPFRKMACLPDNSTKNTMTAGCATLNLVGHNHSLIPSELAFSRTVVGYQFQSGAWKRNYALSASPYNAAPKATLIGPISPFALSTQDSVVQGLPLGARWPRMLSQAVSSLNNRSLVLFYARDGLRPYSAKSSTDFSISTTGASTTSVNRLWMATYSTTEGYSTAAVIGQDTGTYGKANNSSLNSDLEVCETADPFSGETVWPATSTNWYSGSVSCIVGADPYRSHLTQGPLDAPNFQYDVPPIPGAMNEFGNAAIGMHRKDADGYVRFFVARWGPSTGLTEFVPIDDGTNFTMGGSLAIDGAGNIAAVWEGRSLVSQTSRSDYSSTVTIGSCSSGSCAENHIYFRYYNASSQRWTDVVQVDADLSITNYGTVDISALTTQKRTQMMPNIAFNDNSSTTAATKALITWTGPLCADIASTSCRRSQMAREVSIGSGGL